MLYSFRYFLVNKLIKACLFLFVVYMSIIPFAKAELIDRTTFRYATPEVEGESNITYQTTADNSIILTVDRRHAEAVIEPQANMQTTLSDYPQRSVRERLTAYVSDHTRYVLQYTQGIDGSSFKVERTFIGTPNGLPEGLMFISDVKYRKGLFWKSARVGFIIPGVKGISPEEVVYFTYSH